MSWKWCSGIMLGWLIITCSSLHEDQIGKFDWHQKYLGPVRFMFNDPQQPKRLLVGSENNVIGAIHGNNGNLLYRQLLEGSGKLLFYGLHEERQTIAVSIQDENLVKIRTFSAPTGTKVDEWVVQSQATTATTHASKVYLINSNTNQVVAFNLNDGLTSAAKEYKNLVVGGICGVTNQYYVCGKGNTISLLNLEDGSLSIKKLEDEVLELSTSGSGQIPAVAAYSGGSSAVFMILENSKSGPELLPLDLNPSGKIVLSQFSGDKKSLLFVGRLGSEKNVIKLESYNQNGVIVESVSVKASMPISAPILLHGFVINNRYGLAGVGRDELVFGVKLDGPPTKSLEVDWTREESLTAVKAVEMVDYPSEVGPTWNPYLATKNLLAAFISRIKYEIETLISGESLYASHEDRFGLRKVIVFVTKVGKVVGMDSSSGNIIYTFLLPEFSLFSDSSTFLYIQRPAKYTPLKPQATVVYKSAVSGKTFVFAFDPVEGKPLDNVRQFPPIVQAQMLHHAGEETKYVKQILLLDSEKNIHIYPSGGTEEVKHTFFFTAKNAGGSVGLSGVAVVMIGNKLKAKDLWEFSLGQSDLVGVYGKVPTERVHSQGRVLPDRSVSYKYMNPNLVVVVTAEVEAGNINLFLVDAVSGALIHSFWHKKCRGPVHLVHSEHWIVYSLFNEKNRRFEINSVELYEGQSQSNSTAFSSFSAPTVEPIIVKQSYIFPTSIQHLAHTRTEKGITNKDILIALPTGGILELPRIVVQPRLSQQHYTQQIQDEDGVIHHVPYQPELPVVSEMIVNYNQSVKRVDGIRTWPTRLESTCLLLVHGSDLYYTKLTPSKTFDILKDDFDHWIISLALIGLSTAAYAAKRFSARKQLDQAWK